MTQFSRFFLGGFSRSVTMPFRGAWLLAIGWLGINRYDETETAEFRPIPDARECKGEFTLNPTFKPAQHIE
jgi:hypothetical protein